MHDDGRARRAFYEGRTARMGSDEIRAYSLGQSDAYNNVFIAFVIAFDLGQDIHDLYARISAQWDAVRSTQTARTAS